MAALTNDDAADGKIGCAVSLDVNDSTLEIVHEFRPSQNSHVSNLKKESAERLSSSVYRYSIDSSSLDMLD